jgi:hypothetical protein
MQKVKNNKRRRRYTVSIFIDQKLFVGSSSNAFDRIFNQLTPRRRMLHKVPNPNHTGALRTNSFAGPTFEYVIPGERCYKVFSPKDMLQLSWAFSTRVQNINILCNALPHNNNF